MFFPDRDRAEDFLHAFARTHFPDKDTGRRQEGDKLKEIDVSGKRRLMILSGPDHILFVLGLILVGGPWRRLLGVVTAFTLAHSLTLSLSALGMTSLPSTLVEPAIALSIVAVGIENLLRRKADFEIRVWLAFAFG